MKQTIKILLTAATGLACFASASCRHRTITAAGAMNEPVAIAAATPADAKTRVDMAVKDSLNAIANSREDVKLILGILQYNIKEKNMLRSTIQNSSNDAARQYAQQMLNDHVQIEQQIKDVCKKGRYVLSIEDTSAGMNISDKAGSQWDRAWIAEEINTHQDIVIDLKNAREGITDPNLAAFVDNTLPTLQNHLDMSKDLRRQVARR
jgi:putative membrane protein